MTTEEFSNEFDTLIQAYIQTSSFGETDKIAFDEYEKSVFLTKAQEETVINLYNGKNSFGDSFEKTEEIRRYLSGLNKITKVSDKYEGEECIGLSSNSIFYKLPEDLWFITYEAVNLKDDKLGCVNGDNILVMPVTQDEYHRIKKNPFRGTNERRVLRLDLNQNIVEIISKYNIENYIVKYLSKPSPIILSDLPQNLSINGENEKSECKLNPAIHRVILEKAVQLAIISRGLNAVKE